VSSVHFRAGQKADTAAIAALATFVFLDTYATEGLREDLAREAFSGYSETAFDARLRDPATEFVLACVDEAHLVGFAEIVRGRPCPARRMLTQTELVRLYVHPRFQRRGIGTALLAGAEERGDVWLTAWSGNANALAFYAARGYQRVGTMPYMIESRTYENVILAR
jgi:diamine N-acetyltransferase